MIKQHSKHMYRNDPDSAHQTCIRCGCKKVRKTVNYVTKSFYYDRNGNLLDGNPEECKSLYDLLMEE